MFNCVENAQYRPKNWSLKLLNWRIQPWGLQRLLLMNGWSSDNPSYSVRESGMLTIFTRISDTIFQFVLTPARKSEQTVVSVEKRWSKISDQRFCFCLLVQPFSDMPQLQMSLVVITCLTFSSLHLGNIPNK